MKPYPDYYGSLERLPLAPLKGKPPPYASRRQHEAKRGNQRKGLSSSVGDLTATTTTARNHGNTAANNSSRYTTDREKDRGKSSISIDHKARHNGSSDATNGSRTPQLHHQRIGSIVAPNSHYTKDGRTQYDVTNTTEHLAEPQTESSRGRKRNSDGTDRLSKPHKHSGTEWNDKNTDKSMNYRFTEQSGKEKSSNYRITERSGTKTGAQDGRALTERGTEDADSMDRKNSTPNNTLRNYRELAAIPDHTLIAWTRSKSLSDIDSVDQEEEEDEKTSILSKSVEEVDCYRKVETDTYHLSDNTTTTSTSSPASYTPTHLSTNNQEIKGDDDDGGGDGSGDGGGDGVFMAFPVFLESTPSSSSSSSPSPSPSPSPQQEDISWSSKESGLRSPPRDVRESAGGSEGRSALSTLRQEILHLTRLKEEIEHNLMRSQEALKDQVCGLRQEREGLAAEVDMREKRLHTQEAEIKDLKDTVAQLQTLVLTNDGEVKLQRQASDLQEQLREEKRFHREETTQLRREVRSLTSRLQEKENQLEKYRSSPSLSSWGSGGLGKRQTGEWKTSLPDVRNVELTTSLRSSATGTRNSLSASSDSSDDSQSSAMDSLGYKEPKAMENVLGGTNVAPVRSQTSIPSSRDFDRLPRGVLMPHVSPVKSNIATKTSEKARTTSGGAPRPLTAGVRPDSAVRSSRESVRISGSHLPRGRDVGKTPDDQKGKSRVKTVLSTLNVKLDNRKSKGEAEKVKNIDYTRPGGYNRTSKLSTGVALTKSFVPHVSRHSATFETAPSSPRITREAGTNTTSPLNPPSLQLTRSTATPSQRTQANQVTKQPTHVSSQVTMSQDSHQAQLRSTGSSQIPKGPSTEPGVKTSWMYKPINGIGGNPSEGRQRGVPDTITERRTQQSGRTEMIEKTDSTSGGTSYITATIQCLFTIPKLRLFIREKFRVQGVRKEMGEAVAGAFKALESGSGELRAIKRLKEAVQRRDKIFLLHQDPPAADLLSCLLAWLHSDLAPQPSGDSQASSIVSRLFHGLRESLIVCPRQRTVISSALESFNFLTLSVPGEGGWSLRELLDRRFRPQEVVWECRQCGRQHLCVHETHLLRPPSVLVLYLRKPSGVAARVVYPDAGLSLQQHDRPREAATSRSPEYLLVGVVSREEGEGGGSKYSAYCRRLEGGHWGLWEEEGVSMASRRQILSQADAHLLFYHQQDSFVPVTRLRDTPPSTRQDFQSTCF